MRAAGGSRRHETDRGRHHTHPLRRGLQRAAGITATEVQGVRREKNSTEVYRGAAYSVSFRSKIKIEVAVTDEQLDQVVGIIASAGNGDGSVFVTSLEQAIPMRKRESCAGAA